MEVLSGASSVIAVVSLAIQLGDLSKKLCDFWESVKEVPNEIELILSDLSTINRLANIIRQEAESPRPHTQLLDLNITALGQCLKSITNLHDLTTKYQSGSLSGSRKIQTWSACKVVWKADKIKNMLETLKDAKLTLMLARQESLNLVACVECDTQDQALTLLKCVDERQKSTQEKLAAIETTLQGMLIAHNTITRPKKVVQSDVNQHIAGFKTMITSATSTIKNPLLRHALQQELDSMLPRLASCLTQVSEFEPGTDEPALRKITEVALLRPRKTKMYNKLIGTFSTRSLFGTLRLTTISSTTFTQQQYGGQIFQELRSIQTKAVLHSAEWLQVCGLQRGILMQLSLSSWGLDYSLKSYRAIPNNAKMEIYELSKHCSTVASPPHGILIPKASLRFLYAKVDLCRILIEQGAEVNTKSSTRRDISSWACLRVPENTPPTRCVDRINTIRLFVQDLDIWDYINSSGLLGLRRLIATPCNHRNFNHPPSSPVAFDWLFPQLQAEIDVAVEAVGRNFAAMLFTAMGYSDIRPLERLLLALETVNTTHLTRWFSPAHFIASRLDTQMYRNSFKYLISHGLDMHIIADERYAREDEYDAIRGQTPTTIAMRYYLSFFKFRKLLGSCNVDVATFISTELRCGRVLEDSGWTQETLQDLFDLDYDPIPMPKVCCQSDDHDIDSAIWSFGRESCWENFLINLRNVKACSVDVPKLLYEARQSFREESTEAEDILCYSCQMRQRREGCYEGQEVTYNSCILHAHNPDNTRPRPQG